MSYDACAPHMNGKSWCSVNTDEYSNHINGDENWKFCESSCPISSATLPSKGVDSLKEGECTFRKKKEAWKGTPLNILKIQIKNNYDIINVS